MTENETLDEIRQLCNQLQRLHERAPPRGVALATLSALLETCRTSHPLTLKPPIVAKVNDSHITHHDKSTNTDTNIAHMQHTTSNGCAAKITITDETGNDNQVKHRQSSIINKIVVDGSGGVGGEQCVTFCADSDNKNSEENQSTSNLNYENLKLQCMCSSFDQSFDDYTELCNCSKTKSLDLKCQQCNKICKQSKMKCCHNDNNVNNSNLCDKIVKRLSDISLIEINNEQSSNRHVHIINDENYVLDSSPNNIKKNPLILSKSDDYSLKQQHNLRLIKSHNNLPVEDCSLPHNLNNEISTTQSQDELSLNLGSKLEAPTNIEIDVIKNNEVSGLTNEGTGANLNKRKQLVLDLNDRSKYTKEVSV